MRRKPIESPDKWGAKKNNPLILGEEGVLDSTFMGTDDEQMLVDRFIVKWSERVHPYTKYQRNVLLSGMGQAYWMKNIKNLYKRFVLHEGWEEKKFVMAIDDILSTSQELTVKRLLDAGDLYDNGRLAIQLRERKGRKRI